MAELVAIAVGLAMAINLGIARIVVKSNRKGAIYHILSADRCFNEFSLIFEDIFLLVILI